MKAKIAKCLACVLLIFPGAIQAQQHGKAGHAALYSGLEARDIKSLSADDVAELRRGGGWGFALPAELNGLPGPAHLLELQDDLGLSVDQVAQIEAMHQRMRTRAIAAGDQFIQAEANLSDAFKDADLTADELRSLIAAASDARAELRNIHLSQHLATPQLLTRDQIEKYAVLRGYSENPCLAIPDGHDPNKWRQHNGCD